MFENDHFQNCVYFRCFLFMERKQDYNVTSVKMLKFAFKDVSTKNSEPTYWTILFVMLQICVLFLSHLLCHLIYLRSVSCTQYCSVSLYCPFLNDPLVFLNVYLYWFQFFVQMRMTDTSVVRVILMLCLDYSFKMCNDNLD
jgi:hypothetical protein